LKQQIQQLFFGKLAKASSFLFAGIVVTGLLGYIFQIIMGRMLSVVEYGTFTALMAVIMLIGAPLKTLSMLVSREVSAYRQNQNISALTSIFYIVNSRIFLFSIFITIISLFFIQPLQNLLSIDKYIDFFLFISIILIAIPYAVIVAFLQGLQYFKWLSIAGVLAILLKILVAVILIFLGFGLSGALGGAAISSLIVLFLTYFAVRPSIGVKFNPSKIKINFSYGFFFPVFLANIGFAVMTQIDMVMVKYYFSEQDAGIYAAASILGKAVMYLPGGIVMALFPMVAENQSDGKSSSNYLIQAVIVTSILCSIGAFLYYYFSDSLIILLYGKEYLPSAQLLKYFGFAMIPMALIMVAEHFLIAKGKVLFAYLFIFIAPLQVTAIYYFHITLLNIVLIISITGITTLVIGYSLLLNTYLNEKKATQL
jgi:O-antigen/teichoic acid export membrane protein